MKGEDTHTQRGTPNINLACVTFSAVIALWKGLHLQMKNPIFQFRIFPISHLPSWLINLPIVSLLTIQQFSRGCSALGKFMIFTISGTKGGEVRYIRQEVGGNSLHPLSCHVSHWGLLSDCYGKCLLKPDLVWGLFFRCLDESSKLAIFLLLTEFWKQLILRTPVNLGPF